MNKKATTKKRPAKKKAPAKKAAVIDSLPQTTHDGKVMKFDDSDVVQTKTDDQLRLDRVEHTLRLLLDELDHRSVIGGATVKELLHALNGDSDGNNKEEDRKENSKEESTS